MAKGHRDIQHSRPLRKTTKESYTIKNIETKKVVVGGCSSDSGCWRRRDGGGGGGTNGGGGGWWRMEILRYGNIKIY